MQTSRLQVDLQPNGAGTRLVLTGYMDEHTQLFELVASLVFPVEVDLGGVRRINSVGVRNWIEFIEHACARGLVSLWRCPEVLVHQFSMVSQTLGSAVVRSVLAPYRCVSCASMVYTELE